MVRRCRPVCAELWVLLEARVAVGAALAPHGAHGGLVTVPVRPHQVNLGQRVLRGFVGHKLVGVVQR